ncbi:peptidoglycan DD-metalloendopeptidase family protein [Candidatus Parcubacteria bacterium]|nr:peptidoglycan DD-metalloendopeptidase family protein [Candidatus Parcubacteria bacterium]
MKRLFFISLVCLSFLAIVPARGLASEVADLQKKIADINTERQKLLEEQKQLQIQIDEAAKQGQSLSGTIKTLEASKKKIDNDLKVTQSSINAANLTIQKLTLTIGEKERQVDIHTEAIAEGVRRLYGYDKTSFLASMLTEKNLNDLWQDQSNLIGLEDTLNNEISALKSAELELNKEKDQKLAKKSELSGLQKQLSGQKQTVLETQTAKAKLLLDTKSQEAAYQKLLAQKIAQEKQFEDMLFQFESELKVALNPSSFPGATHSILAWPVDKVRVTQQFGKTADSGRLYASGTHNGADFGVPIGSAIHAVRKGVIRAQGNTDEQKGCYSYGRWILVEHDNGLSTIYGHLSSSIASTGQSVNTGDIIGYSGGTPGAYGSGYSTGPHLHLGLYATQAVKVAQYSTSINCKNTVIPLAPPEGYLDPLAYMPAL